MRVRPKGLDHTSHLVPKDLAAPKLQIADPPMGIILQIRSTNPHSLDPDQDLTRGW